MHYWTPTVLLLLMVGCSHAADVSITEMCTKMANMLLDTKDTWTETHENTVLSPFLRTPDLPFPPFKLFIPKIKVTYKDLMSCLHVDFSYLIFHESQILSQLQDNEEIWIHPSPTTNKLFAEKYPAKFPTAFPSTIECISMKRTSNTSFTINYSDCSTLRRPICRFQPFSTPLSYNLATHMASIIINPENFKTDLVMSTTDIGAFFAQGMGRPSHLDTITLQFCTLFTIMQQSVFSSHESSNDISEDFSPNDTISSDDNKNCSTIHVFFDYCITDVQIGNYSLFIIASTSLLFVIAKTIVIIFHMCNLCIKIQCCCQKPPTTVPRCRFTAIPDDQD